MKILKIKRNKGFTLVETIVAIYILLLVVVAGFTSAFVALSSSIFAKNQITAFYLAQDAFDYIRNARDVNIINGDDWLDGLGQGCVESCAIDTYIGGVSPGTDSVDLYLSDSVYNHAHIGNKTNFSRVVKITEEVPGQEALVEITVSWTQGQRESSFTAYFRIFNSLID